MGNNKLKISVVTVSYNAAETIEETIQSVVNQTYDNIEYIIIDGGSTDGTLDIIKKYADRLAYWVSEPDNGIYDAMNKGIAVASGDYINFMNAGDKFINSKIVDLLSKQIVESDDVIYGNWKIDDYSNKIRYPRNLNNMKFGSCLCHQSTFTKTSLLKLRGYDTSYRIAADYEKACSLYTQGYKFKYINEVIADYSIDGVSDIQTMLSLYEAKIISNKYFTSDFTNIYFLYSKSKAKMKALLKKMVGMNLFTKIRYLIK